MRFPFDEDSLQNYLDILQDVLLNKGEEKQKRIERDQTIKRFGASLFDALVVGDIRSRYDISLHEALQHGKGLRLRLHIEPPELAMVPWEYLYDARQGDYVCLSRYTPIIRYLDLPQPIQTLKARLPLRILAMTASPNNLDPVDLVIERQRLHDALKDLEASGQVQITWLSGQTRGDLQQAMQPGQGPWHIFHFIGHGGFDTHSGEGVLALANEMGHLQLLPAPHLARLLADHKSLRLVVLNACEGAKGNRQNRFSSSASTLAQRGIPAVLAMQNEITDAAAIDLTRVFYQALADGMPVDVAVAEARKAISLEKAGTLEWGTPVLYLRSPDGSLFHLQQTKKNLPPEQAPEYWLKLGVQLVKEKHLEEALAAFERAIQFGPVSASAYQQKAEVLKSLRRLEEALRAYDQALQRDPHLAAAFFGKADVLRSLSRPEEALQAYQRGLLAVAHRNRWRVYRVSKVWARGLAGLAGFMEVSIVSILLGFSPVPTSSPLLDLIRAHAVLSLLIGGVVVAASVAALLFSRWPEAGGEAPQPDRQFMRRLVFSNVLATTSTTLLIMLLAIVLIRPPWCPTALCPVNPTLPGVHDSNLDVFFTAVQSSYHVIPGDPGQYTLSNLPRSIGALRLGDQQQPPYRVVLGIHSLQQGRFGLLIREVDLVVVQVAPVPHPLKIWAEQQRNYDTNVFEVLYITQEPGTITTASYVTAPEGDVQLVPGETDELDLQVIPKVAADLHFRVQVVYRVTNESQDHTLLLPNLFEFISSDASNWHLYQLQGGQFVAGP